MSDTVTAADAVADCIRSRRTTKLFIDRPVPREHVLAAIELARWAPNHHLTEPWHFYLLGEQSRLQTIELIKTITHDNKGPELAAFKAESAAAIPGWLVVTCKRSSDALLEREDYAACCCAIHNLTLYLSAHGISAKWSTGPVTRDARLFELLNIDADRKFVVGLIWFGYPSVKPEQSRSELDSSFTELD